MSYMSYLGGLTSLVSEGRSGSWAADPEWMWDMARGAQGPHGPVGQTRAWA